MSTINLLYEHEYRINDNIKIMIPTVKDIVENEDQYYSMVSMLTAVPYDMMVQLDDMGIDFTKINDYDLFLILFSGLQKMDTSLIFGDLDLSKFHVAENKANGTIVLINVEDPSVIIDRGIQMKIAQTLRHIHHLERTNKKPGNEDAKEYLIKRAREKQRRHKNKSTSSQLEELIISLVNTEQYKYDYESTGGLTIYQFNESAHQIINKIDYEHRMFGVYSGSIKASDLSNDELSWLAHK